MKSFKIYPEFKQKLVERAKKIGLNLNLDNPITIQDKINWMKLYDSTPLKTKCADKIQVHEYCKEKLGVDICIPILKIYNSTEEIKWSELPKKFVIKCNHGSGMNIIVRDKDKLDIPGTVEKLKKFMADDFAFHVGYEMHYHDIPHKIFVEEYKEDENQKNSLIDYKFWCFDGDPKFMTIGDGNGHGGFKYYDMNFFSIDIKRTDYKELPWEPEKPKNFDVMIEYARKLSSDFPLVRVDFYEINGKLYLGELTFTPGAGFFKFTKPKYDRLLGEMITIDEKMVSCVKEENYINVISHNCVGARMYQQRNEEYGNPFMWCVIPPHDFSYLYSNYENINFNNFKLLKTNDGYKIVVDEKVNVYYPHYKYDPAAKTPTVRQKDGIDIYYKDIEKYIVDKYTTRLQRMHNKPLFVITDREFVVNKKFNFTRNDLLQYINKNDCLIVTADKTLTGDNIIYVPHKKLDPEEISKIILESNKWSRNE